MARFERGQGKRRQAWEIAQVGTWVRAQESSGDYSMLPGFLQCGSDLGARTEVEKLVSDWLAKGFVPADSQAEKLAAASPQPEPAKAGPSWPLRTDVQVYNESNGFVVTSMDMAGQAIGEGSKRWLRSVGEGKLIPLTLVSDDPINVRVVGGQELTEQEAREWVARLEWSLEVPDGWLALTGGAVLTHEDYTAEDAYFEAYLQTVSVPPGRYRVDLYTYLPGVNGEAALDELAERTEVGQPFGAWWRATREGEVFPSWLRQRCVEDPSIDPGHESEWEGVEILDDEELPETIDFLVHLTAEPEPGPVRVFQEPDGWFPSESGARRPQGCPRGLEARELQKDLHQIGEGNWIYVSEIAPLMRSFPASPLSDGPLPIASSQLAHLYGLARFCHPYAVPQFVAEGEFRDLQGGGESQSAVLLTTDRRIDLYFSNDDVPDEHQRALAEIAPWLSGLPVGTAWELCCGQNDPRATQEEHPLGFHRYVGRVTETGWSVEASYPAVSTQVLREALELAREVEKGESFTLRDEEEAGPVQELTRRNHSLWLGDHEVAVRDGSLSVRPANPDTLQVYAAAAFALRYHDTWPVLDHSADD